VAAKAFVLIETEVGKTKEVVSALGKLKGVLSVDTVTGPYDIIAVLQGDSRHIPHSDLPGDIA
jgi:DNA-binding Lrp family transcriptional regulator